MVLHDYGVSRTVDNMPDSRLTKVADAIRNAMPVLSAAGVAAPRVDAELLAAFVLDVPRSRLHLAGGLDPAEYERFRALVARRAQRIPLQHLTGSAGFHRVELAVGTGVFVPRPETELLVEWGLRALEGAAPLVVDLCSGTGAIALAVAHERPDATVYAVEVDADALRWLSRNVTTLSAGHVVVVAGDATDPATLSTMDGQVDLVLCNPPYVPEGTVVPMEVADHDPSGAVFAGPDGLAVIRGVIGRAAALLRVGGWLGIEHDDTQAEVVRRLLTRAGFGAVEEHSDLAGRPRFATARRLKDSST
jgi:release factor glutamine methyltransferase